MKSISIMAAALALAPLTYGAAPTGFTPNQPTVWCKFDGDARNYGSGKIAWRLEGVAYQENALYLNGKYRLPNQPESDGARATCVVENFTKERFTVALRFKRDPNRDSRQILMGGTGLRWFGIQVGLPGSLELTFNGNALILPVAGVKLRDDGWNWLVCSVNVPTRQCTLSLNGQAARPIALPQDFAYIVPKPAANATPYPVAGIEKWDNAWTFTNYSNAHTFAGWVDEFMFYHRELTTVEANGLAHRPEMLEPMRPAVTAPPATNAPKTLSGNVPAKPGVQLSAADLAEHSGVLEISSIGSSFSLAARVTGKYSWNAARVKLKIKTAEVVRQAKGNAPDRNVRGFQFYIRRDNPAQKHMDIAGRSQIVPMEAIITHGQAAVIDEVEVEIPVKAGVSVAEMSQMRLGVFIYDSPAVSGGREGICVAESKARLGGALIPQEIAQANKQK